MSLAALIDTYTVNQETCIGCDACCVSFPSAFTMKPDNKAEAVAPMTREAANPWDVVGCCPVDAISLVSGEMPEKPKNFTVELHEVEGWQEQWSLHQHDEDPRDERDRRYGLVRDVIETDREYVVRFLFPTRVPHSRLKYMYGLPDEMPDYKYDIVMEERRLVLTAEMEDGKVKNLCYKVNSFPGKFTAAVEFDSPVKSFSPFYENKVLEIRLEKAVTTGRVPSTGKHFMTEDCTGCGVCLPRCPTEAITGAKRVLHVIDPAKCINCSVCGIYCAFGAVLDPDGKVVPHVKTRDIPKAKVIPELCTGCEFCVDACPFDCIRMEPADNEFFKIAVVDEKPCVSCKICEEVCAKGAIVVPRDFDFDRGDIGWSIQPT